MKLAVAGKGGVGKTIITGTLARLLAQDHQRVLALDADSNPNLAFSLGISREQLAQAVPVPSGLTEWRADSEGKAFVHLRQPIPQFIADYGLAAPDGIQLLVMGEVLQASAGCRCEAHALARGITGDLLTEADVAVVDMEAGLEHLGRGTTEHVDILLIVVEPYYRALEAASRIRELAVQLAVPQIVVAANRVRTPQEHEAVVQFCHKHNLELVAAIPFDEAIMEAEQHGLAPIDYAPQSPAIQSIRNLATLLSARIG
ncbi:MAG: AAA family ATPase [Chloroflexota bacterium]|nr:AAA family ATPase [Chloroflexota bacterium]